MDIHTGQGTGAEIWMSVPLAGTASKERNY